MCMEVIYTLIYYKTFIVKHTEWVQGSVFRGLEASSRVTARRNHAEKSSLFHSAV